MNRTIGLALAVAVLLAMSLSACSSETPTTPTPTGEKVTETFSGTISAGGFSLHPFTANLAGPVVATLTALSPESTTSVVLELGTYSYELCSAVVANNNATVNSVTVGMATAQVNLCLYLADGGNVTETTSYTVTVSHY
jgi:outer membrane protein assembly factor BamE (lipoprotein component of BamABCDE complex)